MIIDGTRSTIVLLPDQGVVFQGRAYRAGDLVDGVAIRQEEAPAHFTAIDILVEGRAAILVQGASLEMGRAQLLAPGPLQRVPVDAAITAHIALMAAEIALAHHERWDGKGYPNQLAGQAIPLSGRIVTIVDFYDALTMDRVYRPAFSHEKALEMLLAERGKAFDPDIVDCVLRNSAAISALREQVTVGRMTFSDLINRKQEAP